MRCTSCHLVFIDPQPSTEEIAELYSEDYFTACSDTCGAHGREAYMEVASRAGAERACSARKLDAIFRRHAGTDARLLEVGCGPGFLLVEFRKLGWQVRGLEISEYAARHATQELGVDVAVAAIGAAPVAASTIDVVYMGDVLEHLAEPLSALRAVRTWLVSGGAVVIAVPATLNLVSAKLGMAAYQTLRRVKTLRIPPYHLFEFTPRSLRHMLTTAGFDLRELRQSAVPISRMGLRGNLLENAAKVSWQLMAHLTSRLLNRGGDRLLAVGVKP